MDEQKQDIREVYGTRWIVETDATGEWWHPIPDGVVWVPEAEEEP